MSYDVMWTVTAENKKSDITEASSGSNCTVVVGDVHVFYLPYLFFWGRFVVCCHVA